MSGLPAWPRVDFSEFGEIEVKPLGKIQQLTGAFLGRNWVAIPHVTHHDAADITDLEVSRKTWNDQNSDGKLTTLILLIKAVVNALKNFPQFNASLDADGRNLVYKKYFHIGIAVDTPRGLMVPVLRDCDKKSVGEIAKELAALSLKARNKGLSMPEMSGGCFTISSIGAFGGTGFTPIINAPEVGILGVTRAQTQACQGANGEIIWRNILPLSLSYDHRVINGADAARFVTFIAKQLADPSLFL
ncbi:MAG: 2-oxo acid dehydrogenase subunit E2 [Acidocella sp.]|nr:2-oxo acid dehydrogenase subunit E2 [Acidocella sp.]